MAPLIRRGLAFTSHRRSRRIRHFTHADEQCSNGEGLDIEKSVRIARMLHPLSAGTRAEHAGTIACMFMRRSEPECHGGDSQAIGEAPEYRRGPPT